MIIKSNFIPQELYDKHVLSKFENIPISIFNDYVPTLEELSLNPYNILLILEPNELFGLHDWAIGSASSFDCILTWSQKILDSCQNAILLPWGTTFLHKNYRFKELAVMEKKFELSFICGHKNYTQGHKLRHTLFEKFKHIEIPVKKYYTTEEPKEICFRNSMFHLAVENTRNQNYFTDKIVDAFLTNTIPIYWGCPNIGDFFDERGMIILDSEEDFVSLVNNLTEEDYYSRKKYMEDNYIRAIHYAEVFMRINSILEEIVKLNNL